MLVNQGLDMSTAEDSSTVQAERMNMCAKRTCSY